MSRGMISALMGFATMFYNNDYTFDDDTSLKRLPRKLKKRLIYKEKGYKRKMLYLPKYRRLELQQLSKHKCKRKELMQNLLKQKQTN